MKCMKIASKALFFVLAALSVFVFSSLLYLDGKLSDSYKIGDGESLEIESALPISISYKDAVADNSYDAKVKVFGFIPFRNITVDVIDDYSVALLGTPFGIKIYTDGVLVVDFSEVKTAKGVKNPAKNAGIKEGDFIVSLDGTNVYTNEDVMDIVKNSMGEIITARIVRGGVKMTIRFKAVLSEEGVYRAGMWVKDSSAGIGTLTFYSPVTNVICGLGHGIADNDTGTLLSLNHGEFVGAKIVSVEKGTSGNPGELKGRFLLKSISNFARNSDNGVYGSAKCKIETSNLIKIAMKQEVKNGAAHILTTIDGETPEYYSCNIKIKSMGATQNMLVEVTDKRLLEKTGGIVQGMSGSPIIQNGKLIGAVTHVLVDDSKKGYAIFAETMLQTAESVGKEQLKNA